MYKLSKAQQSCVSATALEQKIKKQEHWVLESIKNRGGNWIKKKTIQNQSRLNRKSIKKRAKINRISIKNRPTIDPTIDQNHRWSEKCRALRLGSRLGGVLEASWAHLRGQHSSKLASQIEGKSIKNQCKNRSKKSMPSKCQCWCNFGGFSEGKTKACWHQNRINYRCQLRTANFAKSIEN